MVEWLLGRLGVAGLDLREIGLAWARAIPSVALVPAFGLRALPLAVRGVVALGLMTCVAPALRPIPIRGEWWPWLLLEQSLRGLPVALTAAVALWAATMAGAVIDDLRRATERVALPTVESSTTPGGAVLGMLAAVAFLQGGGPARVAAALAEPGLEVVGPLRAAAFNLAGGIQLAVAVAAPVIVAAIVWELGSALMARAAAPAFVAPLLAPLRSLVLLMAAALLFERMLQVALVLSPTVP